MINSGFIPALSSSSNFFGRGGDQGFIATVVALPPFPEPEEPAKSLCDNTLVPLRTRSISVVPLVNMSPALSPQYGQNLELAAISAPHEHVIVLSLAFVFV